MRENYSLNFGWEYHPNYRDEYLEKWYKVKNAILVDFPHNNRELTFNGFDEVDYQHIFSYRKAVNIPNSFKGRMLKMQFGGVSSYVEVYCNGELCGSHQGAYLPFEIDLTNRVFYGKDNLIVLKVDALEDEDVPPFGGAMDYLAYGGVYREVNLAVLMPEHITDIYARTDNVLTEAKKWEIDVEVSSENLENELLLELYDSDDVPVTTLASGRVSGLVTSFAGEIKDVNLWSIENPYLYSLKISLIRGQEILDSVSKKIGFRSAEFTSDGFVLNDRKIKLIGLNRHQSYPYVGYAMPKSAQYDDADFLKSIGVNVVRSSHYPPSEHFLNRCDEIGILVIEEIPGWQHIGAGAIWRKRAVDNVRDMIVRDRNHPCVIMWGVRINESADDAELYALTNKTAKEYDTTRATGGVRNLVGSQFLEDVYTFNDFSNNGGKIKLKKSRSVTKLGKDVPYLVTEFNGHMFPTKSFDTDNLRLEHALRHADVLNAMMGDPKISGAIGWCMADYNTHKDFGSGDSVCYHGVSDMFRAHKIAAYVYASQNKFIPVLEIAGSLCIGDHPAGFIDKTYAFTNCDYIKVYRNDSLVGKFYPDRKRFPNLAFPPILLDDLVGELLEQEEGFTPTAARRAKRALKSVMRYGENLPFIEKLNVLLLKLITRRTLGELTQVLFKYAVTWGGGGVEYTFEGYKDNALVATIVKGAPRRIVLSAGCSALTLYETETYDTAKINLKYICDRGNIQPYINDVIKISVEGPARVIGPDAVSLMGGQGAVWVRSAGESGNAKVIFESGFGRQEIDLKVVCQRSER